MSVRRTETVVKRVRSDPNTLCKLVDNVCWSVQVVNVIGNKISHRTGRGVRQLRLRPHRWSYSDGFAAAIDAISTVTNPVSVAAVGTTTANNNNNNNNHNNTAVGKATIIATRFEWSAVRTMYQAATGCWRGRFAST